MGDGGYVKEHRSVMEHAVFQDDWLYRLFRWCIMKANFTPGTFKGVAIPVGSFVTGKIRGSEELGVTPSKFHRGIHRLTEAPYEVIQVAANRDWTMITVCNYRTYQNADERSEPPMDRQRTASEPPAKPIEELKNSTISLSLEKTHKQKLPTRYDTPEVRELIPRWKAHWIKVREGATLGDDQLDAQLMDVARLGWDADKLCRSFIRSIAKSARNLIDPDQQHPAFSKPSPAASKLKRVN